MDILSINADQKLLNIASSIGRNPLSWQGWSCLHIKLPDIEQDMQNECLLWTKSIIGSYLNNVEGRVYFCNNGNIHILCKAVPHKILDQAGSQICSLVRSESDIQTEYFIHDLSEDGFLYAHSVLEASGNIFSLPVNIPFGLDKLIGHNADITDTQANARPLSDFQELTKVLLVEDDPVTRWMVRNALKEQCRFASSPSASKAYSMYMSYRPDVVFLDINLPDGNGRSVLEWIMRNDPGACVVMFSSNDDMDNISSALDNGASGFIAKPFLKENLLYYILRYTRHEVSEKA